MENEALVYIYIYTHFAYLYGGVGNICCKHHYLVWNL